MDPRAQAEKQRAAIEGNVPDGTYSSRAYNTKERFCSFWHQLDEVLELGAESVLEVGAGDALVADWLRRAGVGVTTFDIDRRSGADIEGSVTDMPVGDDSYDVVSCCQVLEHLPYEQAEQALGEIARVARNGVVVSVPDQNPYLGIEYPVFYGPHAAALQQRLAGRGRLGTIQAFFRGELNLRELLFALLVPAGWAFGGKTWAASRPPIPHRAHPAKFDGHHHWELGLDGYDVGRLLASFEAVGLKVTKDFRVPQNPWHHFFVAVPSG